MRARFSLSLESFVCYYPRHNKKSGNATLENFKEKDYVARTFDASTDRWRCKSNQ